jgi:hypothetical protein
MVGQKRARAVLSSYIMRTDSNTIILIGVSGSGKKTLIKDILKEHSEIQYVFLQDVKKETVKDVIDSMYKVNTPTVYVIPDIENMSVAAMNSLLKVTEEPPNNSKIILTCSDLYYVLPTLQSRAKKVYMDTYSHNELLEYCTIDGLNYDNDFILSLCSTPGDIDKLFSDGVVEFRNYVNLVFENIDKVSGTNALKIGNKLAFKEDSDGFDLVLFFKAFINLCCQNFGVTKDPKYIDGVNITSTKLDDLRVKGINKSALFDTWVLEIRRLWMV